MPAYDTYIEILEDAVWCVEHDRTELRLVDEEHGGMCKSAREGVISNLYRMRRR